MEIFHSPGILLFCCCCIFGRISVVSLSAGIDHFQNGFPSVAELKKTIESAHFNQLRYGSSLFSDWLKQTSFDHIQREIKKSRLRGSSLSRQSLTSLDPDANKNLTGLIIGEGYPCERFTIQTQDGFLLDLHHIPHGRDNDKNHDRKYMSAKKPVVYLQHGLLASACDWVMNFANGSLGFLLADAGYDVWMGNSRGNTFSRKHIHYHPDQEAFWDWSFDEMAKYDTTAFIDFILNKTGQPSLHYIGHSQGTTMFFALMSSMPQYQNKIRLFTGLAPVTAPAHAKSPIIQLKNIPEELIYLVFGRKDFLPNDFLVKLAVDGLCQEKVTRWICDNIIFLIIGPDMSNFNQSRLAVYLNHSPAGASVKDFMHYKQVIQSDNFTMYDYGNKAINLKHYGQASPPFYNVTKVNVPTIFFSGTYDWLADPEDVKKLNSQLPNVKASYVMPKWNHLDFVWGKDAGTKCYQQILNWLPKF